jgi:tetratricopeptide (TPR) repeat protein
MSLRFRVALSYPGERRPFVQQVAERLAAALGPELVLYDRFLEAEFARPGLSTYLQELYRKESELIVLFLCAEYDKDWCGLELRVVHDLILQRQTSKVMPLRFDATEVPGLLESDGYLWIDKRSAEEVAEKILERLGWKKPAPPASAGQRIGPPHLPRVAAELFGRDDVLQALDRAWQDPKIRVLSLVAWGGVGKTSVVARWADLLAERGYDGADYFEWSFYSQGTRDHNSASADIFLDRALRHFGDEAMADSPAAARDKGARLAALLGNRRALLMLDGLEPLQHPPGPLAGELKDEGVRALLRGLAARNAGFCVVTSRETVADLERWRSSSAPEWELAHLSIPAGVKLLRSLEVWGSEADLAAAVEEVDGHALTLNLIGRYLVRAHGGDVRKRDRVDLYKADEKTASHGHAFRAMGTYERWLSTGDEENRRQLALLRLLGLFDRPAPADCIAALRAEPAIAGITEPLVGINEEDWNGLVSDLGDSRLVATEGESLDAHPLIREYFARELKSRNTTAWREAHGRLFDFLKENAEHQPDTLAGLQPLYQAVYHGCQADRQNEACAEVYFDRILRGSECFSFKKLGAFGADLGAIACFFAAPWNRVFSSLSEAYQAWLLNEAALRLRALGRLREAVEPMRAGSNEAVRLQDWNNAARYACNLGELELTLGDVKAAVNDAEGAVVFADRSGDAFLRMSFRTGLADARHKAGEEEAALALFREAERLQAERQPEYPLLYSLAGFRYCDLLLARAERAAGSGLDARASSREEDCAEVEQRALQMFDWRVPSDSLLTIALDHLSLGRARLYRAILDGRASQGIANARDEIEKAVAGLRAAGAAEFFARGLLTRAWLRFATGDADGAREDLDEAQEIAERGSMRLHLADVALCRARFFRDRDALAEARKLVEECGYLCRLPEIEDLEAQLSGR